MCDRSGLQCAAAALAGIRGMSMSFNDIRAEGKEIERHRYFDRIGKWDHPAPRGAHGDFPSETTWCGRRSRVRRIYGPLHFSLGPFCFECLEILCAKKDPLFQSLATHYRGDRWYLRLNGVRTLKSDDQRVDDIPTRVQLNLEISPRLARKQESGTGTISNCKWGN